MTDFYENDEPVDELLAAFERGEKGVTKRPDDTDMTEDEFDAMMRDGEPCLVIGRRGER